MFHKCADVQQQSDMKCSTDLKPAGPCSGAKCVTLLWMTNCKNLPHMTYLCYIPDSQMCFVYDLTSASLLPLKAPNLLIFSEHNLKALQHKQSCHNQWHRIASWNMELKRKECSLYRIFLNLGLQWLVLWQKKSVVLIITLKKKWGSVVTHQDLNCYILINNKITKCTTYTHTHTYIYITTSKFNLNCVLHFSPL